MFCIKCGNLIHDHFDACGICGQSYMMCPKYNGQGKLFSSVEGWMGPDIYPVRVTHENSTSLIMIPDLITKITSLII